MAQSISPQPNSSPPHLPPIAQHSPASPSLDSADQRLWTRGFVGLLVTQWLTAINDNVFRWLAIDIGKDFLPSDPSLALTLGSVGFVAPFLVFAAPAGFLADRFSKRSVIVVCKIIEIFAMSLGLLAIWYSQFSLLILTVFMMGAQTALFSPSKLGILPEFLSSKKLSAANGWMGLATMTATVIGMFVGGFLKDSTGYLGRDQNFWMPFCTLLGLAVVGTVFSFFIPKTAPADPDTKLKSQTIIDWITFRGPFLDIKELVNRRTLFYVACGIVFFWTIAGVAQLNIDVISAESGGVLASDRTPLLISLVFGVALGNVLAGFLSKGKIELGLVPIGCFIIVVFGLLLSFSPSDFYLDNGPWLATLGTDATWRLVWSCCLLFGLGTGAGLYDVPLASYLQYRAPAKSRGAILSATNFLIFGVMLVAFMGFNFFRAKVDDGSLRKIAPVAAVIDPAQRDVMKTERFADKLAVWDQQWQDKVQKDSVLLRQAQEKATASGDPEHLRELRQLDESLAQQRPSPAILTEGLADETDVQAILALGMWQELVARGVNEMQAPPPNAAVLPIDRTSFGAAYPKYSRLAAKVYDQSLRQPLLSSRYIFLLIALGTAVVFGIILKVLWRDTARFFSSWSTPPVEAQVIGLEHLGEGPVVLLLHDGSRENIDLLYQALKRPLMAARWRCDKTPPLTPLPPGVPEILLYPEIRVFKNARSSDAHGVIKSLSEGMSLALPLFTSRETRLRCDPPSNLPVVLHECRQHGFDAVPVTIRRDQATQPPAIVIHIGAPIPRPGVVENISTSFLALESSTMSPAHVDYTLPAEMMIRRCKQRGGKMKIADSMGQEVSGNDVLLRSLILRRLLNRVVLKPTETNVGLLLPPSTGAVLANMALALDGRTSVNLNYSVSAQVINNCIQQAEIKHVLTTRKVMEKLNITLDAEVVYLEELREQVTLADKATGWLMAKVMPAGMLIKSLGIPQRSQDDVLTLIFTSGSTGDPKGVMLTNRNIACVIDGIDDAVSLNSQDVILGVLPFFHSFGFSVPLWTVMGLDIAGVYHFNPLDPTQIGKLAKKYGATIILATPTFLRTYMKRIDADDFKTLEVVVAGAEKLPVELSDAFETKYGVRPVEGYGATELAPLVSVNQPASRVPKGATQKIKEGSVGTAITNVSTKVLDLDTGQPVSIGQPGMLWISGPNVMKGYLNRPELTQQAIVDGWYNTGDVAIVDEEGFIHITGRLSRFSKIGGEMVPHILVEQHLNELAAAEDGEMRCAVSSTADPKKGEKLVVLHLPLPMTVDQLRDALIKRGVPSLFIPAGNAFYQVDEIPILGTGKLDLKRLKELASELAQ